MSEEDEMFVALLAAAGLEPVKWDTPKTCSSCYRSWEGDEGKIHCGAHPDETPQPRWAVIKYSLFNLVALSKGMRLEGADCEDVPNNLAEGCEAYRHGEES